MKVTVLGAGAIGTAVATDLCRHAAVARVQVCEARPVTLRAFREGHAHPRVRTYEADARDVTTLEPILAGSAVVVSCVAPELNPRLARLAVDVGAHFVDLGSPPPPPAEALALAELAEQRGRHVVTGCGLAPGLVGLLLMRGLARVERPHAVRIRVGDVPEDPSGPFAYRLAHSAEKLIDDYTTPATVLRGGETHTVEPLTGIEPVHVDGLGAMEAFYAGGMGPLAEGRQGQLATLDAKALRYPGHAAQMQFLLDLGFADRTMLDLRTHLSYRDVLVRRLRQRLGGAYRDVVVVQLEIDCEAGTLVYEIVERTDDELGLTAMQRCTGFPAAVAAVLLAERAVPGGGVAAAEAVLPVEPFFERLAARGIAVAERWMQPA